MFKIFISAKNDYLSKLWLIFVNKDNKEEKTYECMVKQTEKQNKKKQNIETGILLLKNKKFCFEGNKENLTKEELEKKVM